MKKSKKIISLLLSILMIITSIPLMAVNSFAAEIFTSGDYQYTVLDDGTAEITKYTGSAAELAIPSEIDGYSVTSIGYRAFFGFYGSSLTSITIPDSVTSIGEDAFSWSALTSITIPDNVTSIGASAFSACTSLASVTIGNGVTSISHNAFGSCTSLTSITIPDSVTSIGYYAFYGCTSLASVTIGNGVTSIAGSAFNGCTSLTEISVNSENANYSSENGVLFNKDKTEIVRYPQGKKDSSYPIPDSVTSIGNDAFYGCTSLSSITIPDSITSIGNSAFNGCTSLASVTIGNGVTSIGNDAFYGCTSLASITIPDSVTSIGNYAFYYCTSLASIIIPNSVTSIGYSAFIGCNSLTEINVSSENANYSSENGVLFNKDKTEIVRYPSGKTATCYSIPDGVTSIGDNAFYGCTSLSSITIPDSVTNIGDHAFYNTAYYNDKSNWDNGTLYIGNHLIKAKSDITESIEIKQGTKTIADSAFSGCTSLTSITIPDSVTSIGDHAFRNNKFLENVIIGNNVTNIGDEAFSYCPVLTSVIIPDSVTSIGNYAFRGCTSLTSITIPNSVTSISHNAFGSCTSLTSITIPDSVTSIGSWAFSGCTSLTSITIPDSVTSIGFRAFLFTSLTSITIPQSVTYISEEALGYYYDNVKIDGFTIYGFGGTKAEKYAKDNSFKFVDLRESESLTVSKAPTKTTYFVDDTLDITGLELTLTYNNGDTETVTSGFTVSGFDSSTAGTKVVTVEYKGKTATFTVEVVEPTVSFPDVSATEWYSNAIAFNVTKGYFHGYANGYFGPADNIQRQDFVVVLAKIANADLSAYAGQNGDFDDVPTNDYYSAAVAWAKANHILSGYANGKFGVGDPITREQACLIFYNYCNGSVSGNVNTVLAGYPDGGNVSDWARTAVAWAAQNNVVGGNGKLNPAGNANRAEMAQIIMNMSNNDIL